MRGYSAAWISSLAGAFFLLITPTAAFAGSRTFSTPGNYNFTVPSYTGSLTVEVWGGGGGGEGCTLIPMPKFISYNYWPGGNGSASSVSGSVIGYGGTGGGTNGQPGGAGSGGDVNLSGEAGSGVRGSPAYASGGGGGSGLDPVNTRHGVAPGGGGDGGAQGCYLYGGGGGGYAKKTYTLGTAGAPAVGATLPVVVGAGGVKGNAVIAQRGAAGQVVIGWSDAPVCPTGQTWNGTACVCPVGTTWNGSACAAPSSSISCSIIFDKNPISTGDTTSINWSSAGSPDALYLKSIGWVGASGSTRIGPTVTTDYSGTVYKCPASTTLNATHDRCVGASSGGTPPQTADCPAELTVGESCPPDTYWDEKTHSCIPGGGPGAPAITAAGACVVNEAQTYTLRSVDSDATATLRYGLD